MILEYDTSKNATAAQMVESLKDSVQRALENVSSSAASEYSELTIGAEKQNVKIDKEGVAIQGKDGKTYVKATQDGITLYDGDGNAVASLDAAGTVTIGEYNVPVGIKYNNLDPIYDTDSDGVIDLGTIGDNEGRVPFGWTQNTLDGSFYRDVIIYDDEQNGTTYRNYIRGALSNTQSGGPLASALAYGLQKIIKNSAGSSKTTNLMYIRGDGVATFSGLRLFTATTYDDDGTPHQTIKNVVASITDGTNTVEASSAGAANIKTLLPDISGKQDVISDLDTIRSGAAAGATALQSVPETYRTAAEQDAIHDGTKQDVIDENNKLSYSLLDDTPTIPDAITEDDVSEWGFTKNEGTVTGVKINGEVKEDTDGVVDLGAVITSLPAATTSVAGITKVGASDGAAAYSHTHSEYATTEDITGVYEACAQSVTVNGSTYNVENGNVNLGTIGGGSGGDQVVVLTTSSSFEDVTTAANTGKPVFLVPSGTKTVYALDWYTATEASFTSIDYDDDDGAFCCRYYTVDSDGWSQKNSSSFAFAGHSHGSISSSGQITTSGIPIASGDALAFVDSSQSNKLTKSSITFDGSTTGKVLSQAGTWVEMTGGSSLVFDHGSDQADSVKSGYVDMPITFNETFSSAPTVIPFPAFTGSAGGMGYISISVDEDSITTTGATIKVYNASSTARTPRFGWVAIGS